ncbi:cyclophilin-like fold protein [Amphibacillus sp. Q70]|uniref:cyclophilin-like fold protein n=1 Tax=Amphibacillus sp. Q70 TaxID=3453416 RepID=UPI003F8414C1
MRSIPLIWLFIFLFISGCSTNNLAPNEQDEEVSSNEHMSTDEEANTIDEDEESMHNILLTINNESFQATLYDNETTEAFIAKLPLSITMNELNGNEKYSNLDESLPSQSEQVEFIETGDLMLFGSDTLVLFYENFSTSYSYTRLGTIDHPENLSTILGNNSITVHIELVD